MDNKNIKEILAANALIFVSMIAFGIVGFSEIGIIIAAGALSFVMLRGNMLSVVLGVVLVFAADFASDLSIDFSGGMVVCLCAFALNFALRAKKGLLFAVVAGVAGVFAAFAISLSVAEIVNIEGLTKLADIRASFGQTNEVIDAVVLQMGFDKIYSATEIAKLKNLTSMIMAPVAFITVSVLISYGALWVLKRMLGRVKSDLGSEIVGFSYIRADKMCSLVWIAAMFLFTSAAMDNQVIGAAAFCMLYILSVFYLVCGVSVIWYFAEKKQGIKKVLFGILIIFGVFFMTPTVFIIGIIDSFINIRKLRKGE